MKRVATKEECYLRTDLNGGLYEGKRKDIMEQSYLCSETFDWFEQIHSMLQDILCHWHGRKDGTDRAKRKE